MNLLNHFRMVYAQFAKGFLVFLYLLVQLCIALAKACVFFADGINLGNIVLYGSVNPALFGDDTFRRKEFIYKLGRCLCVAFYV